MTAKKHTVSVNELYDLSELFKVFGDSTRIRILDALLENDLCVFHLCEKLDMEQSAVSHQLRILKTAGLVRSRKDGRTVCYSLDDEHVQEILSSGLKHIMHKKHMGVI